MDIIADSRQNPLFDVRQFVPVPYKPGSFYFAVEMYAPLIVLRQDFPEPDPSLGGSDGWCPVYLSKLVLIQQKHGWNDRETVQHARTNLQVKACLNVGADAPAPSQPTLTRHRARMQELGLAEAYSERFLDLIEALELVDMVGTVAVDSVPIDGAGQVLDTFNLLAAAIRKGLSELAARTCRPVKQVAASLSLSDYLSRSIKGTAEIDWSDAGQQRAFLTRLVRDARTVQEALRSCGPGDSTGESSAPAGPQDTIRRSSSTNEPQDSPDSSGQGSLLEPDDDVPAPGAPETSEATAQPADAATIIDKIIDHDIEFDAHQNVVGVLQRPAGDRLISVTDADMRHGRKSASSLISGFKVQIVATVMYGWILLTKVIPANRHDGEDLPWIIRRLSELGVNPRYVLGDHAYGVISNHLHVQSLNDAGSSPIELIARNARPSNGGRFTKDEFTIDMDTRTLTCPAGHACKKPAIAMRGKQRGWRFGFPGEVCAACPFREKCVNPKANPKNGRTVFVDPAIEPLIREHLTRRKEPEFINRLKQRQVVERANAGFAQCGGKRARRFGTANLEFDSAMAALAHNMRTLASVAHRNPAVHAALERRRRAFFWLLWAILQRVRGAQHAASGYRLCANRDLPSMRPLLHAMHATVLLLVIRNLIRRRLPQPRIGAITGTESCS